MKEEYFNNKYKKWAFMYKLESVYKSIVPIVWTNMFTLIVDVKNERLQTIQFLCYLIV